MIIKNIRINFPFLLLPPPINDFLRLFRNFITVQLPIKPQLPLPTFPLDNLTRSTLSIKAANSARAHDGHWSARAVAVGRYWSPSGGGELKAEGGDRGGCPLCDRCLRCLHSRSLYEYVFNAKHSRLIEISSHLLGSLDAWYDFLIFEPITWFACFDRKSVIVVIDADRF